MICKPSIIRSVRVTRHIQFDGLKRFRCITALFITAISTSCNRSEINAFSEPDARRVHVAAVKMREIHDEISGFGSLSYSKKIDIASPQDAVIEKLLFREGDAVKRGEKIAVLVNPQITLAVQRAENTYAQAYSALELAEAQLLEGEFQAEARLLEIRKSEAEIAQARRSLEEQRHKLEDQNKLFEAGGISKEAIRDARFSFETSEDQIRLMETQLEIQKIGFRKNDLINAGLSVPDDENMLKKAYISLAITTLMAQKRAAESYVEASKKELASCRLAEAELTLYSPATGIIGARYMEEGERVKKEDKIVTVMDMGCLYAIFPAPEQEALRIKKGMAAKVSVDGTGGTYSGTVDLVSPLADSQSFTFSVRVSLDAQTDGAALKPGMFARVSVVAGSPRMTPVVPEMSLMSKNNVENEVFIVNGNTVSGRKITIGSSIGDEREVLSGLNAGEVVVLKPEVTLKEGAYVSVED
ncbi:MAG: efflux RND transporter periplasmic adaptor subunit [Treponema sp.]|jgi:RND family efflux transporter MFP subunit|nr:efflux RND transporter periplasmic adaptor subunit [Treponema sp.]